MPKNIENTQLLPLKISFLGSWTFPMNELYLFTEDESSGVNLDYYVENDEWMLTNTSISTLFNVFPGWGPSSSFYRMNSPNIETLKTCFLWLSVIHLKTVKLSKIEQFFISRSIFRPLQFRPCSEN